MLFLPFGGGICYNHKGGFHKLQYEKNADKILYQIRYFSVWQCLTYCNYTCILMLNITYNALFNNS